MNKIYNDDELRKLVDLIPDMHIWQNHKDLPQFKESRSRISILIGRYKTRYNLDYNEWEVFYEYEKLSPRDREKELKYQVSLYDEKISKLCQKLRDNFVRELMKLDTESLENRLNDLVNQRLTNRTFDKEWQVIKNKFK
ncbi:hypothetical protein FACS1894192_00680 [Bacilli bacterium]|nr:hypothetical protein FACS1894192_00680 [Bacilli bacterium]